MENMFLIVNIVSIPVCIYCFVAAIKNYRIMLKNHKLHMQMAKTMKLWNKTPFIRNEEELLLDSFEEENILKEEIRYISHTDSIKILI